MNALTSRQATELAEVISEEEAVELARSLLELAREDERAALQNLFPDTGPLRRELYPRHMEFFAAGAKYHERLFIAANRTGKTLGIGFEVSCHLTGRYPRWWEGRRFAKPIDAWVGGKSGETTRDIVQKALLGSVDYEAGRRNFDGIGTIPLACHGKPVFKSNGGGLLDRIAIRHASGRWSKLAFKSYEQGRGAFEGTAKDLIWLDEEPPMDVYGECLIRTTTTDGLMLVGFTPLEGMSEVVRSFLLPEEDGRCPR